MGFIAKLSKMVMKDNSFFVVVEKLSRNAHFIHVRDTYKDYNIAQLFIKDIFILHGFHKKIIWDKASIFIGGFWTSFCVALQTQIHFSIDYDPKTNGQTKRVNKVLEDML